MGWGSCSEPIVGNDGEDDAIFASIFGLVGERKVGPLITSTGYKGGLISAGIGIFNALASAAVIAGALLKRSAGLLASPRRITLDSLGEIVGLTRAIETGIDRVCSSIMA